MNTDALRKYITAMDGSWGCIPRYIASLGEDGKNPAFLLGHYGALLNDMVKLVSRDLLLRLIEAHELGEARVRALMEVPK